MTGIVGQHDRNGHNGTIKNFKVSLGHTLFTYFNSSMVRLKPHLRLNKQT